ncbi:hypothetical protein [Leucobacter aridicollis]|uniref:hypothetical protein n=1 Tax=Leucobacter aridicollis TaxID=283878 RepID=UPI0021063706|nr:hypothetical protein [Leucobacter aridicollis]UTX53302.1 hypothetical protein KI794_00590 [Leucobacter aridicollis]
MEDTLDIDFECGPVDLICKSFESQTQGLTEFLSWVADITLGNHSIAPGSKLWDSAIGESGYWFGLAIVVSLGILSVGIMRGVFQGDIKWPIIGVLSGIPSTILALTVGGKLLEVSAEISKDLLNRIGGGDGFAAAIRTTMQVGTGSDKTGAVLSVLGVGFLPMLILLLVLILGMIVLNFALAFRNFAIMVLIAFAPLAFMAVTTKGGWGLAKKWMNAGIALLIAEPLMFGLLAMILRATKGATLFDGGTLTLGIGLFMTAFMPLMVVKFFDFLGADGVAGDQAGSQMGRSVSQSSKTAVRNVTSVLTRGGSGGGAATRGGSGSTGNRAPAGPKGTSGTSKTGGKSSQNAKPGSTGPSGKQAPGSTPTTPKQGGAPAQRGRAPETPAPKTQGQGQTPGQRARPAAPKPTRGVR